MLTQILQRYFSYEVEFHWKAVMNLGSLVMDDGGLRSLPAGDILESFDSHPPLILPSNTFHLELGKAIVEPALFEQLGHLQEFIRRLPGSETQAEPDVEEQVTSSLTPELSSITRTSGSQEMRHLDVSTCVID